HVAGGIERDGFYHDTHTAPVSQAVLMLVEELAALVDVPGVLIERDDAFPAIGELDVELEALASALERGEARRRTACHVLSRTRGDPCSPRRASGDVGPGADRPG